MIQMIVDQAFNRHQINIDDTDEEDVLVHFLPAISFIQAELDNKRGVLVHCQAGMSASYFAVPVNHPIFIYL
jgi:dual specificity phosphatase 12